MSIVNQTSSAAAASTSGAAITINAGANDSVVLRGLTIVGGGAGSYGIVFSGGASLTVEDCSIRAFTGTGIQFAPSAASELRVSNTRVSHNGAAGINVVPSASRGVTHAVFEHVEADDDAQAGIFIDGRYTGGTVSATVADSVLSDNLVASPSAKGIAAVSGNTTVMVRDTVAANNQYGMAVEVGATMFVGHSTLSGNGTAFYNSGSTLKSYGDNTVDGNGALGATPASVSFH